MSEDITPAPRRMQANPKSASSVCRKEHDAIEGFCDIPPRCVPMDSGEATPDIDAAIERLWRYGNHDDLNVLVAAYREKAAECKRLTWELHNFPKQYGEHVGAEANFVEEQARD